MKVLVVGAGSIGSRHARNATTYAEVSVVDADANRAREVASEIGGRAHRSLDEALADPPDIAIVATPADRHIGIAGRLLEAGCRVLVEKPIATDLAESRTLLGRLPRGRRLFVACNMRFHPGPRTLRAHLGAVGRPLFARAHFGHWLLNMRPHADYRSLYCAHRETGGGVVLDGIHELDYLVWLLGPVVEASGCAARLSSLKVDVEDYAAITLVHASGARSEIHLDYLQHCKRRGCEIAGTEGTLLWESEGKRPEHCRVRLFRRDTGAWQTLHEADDVDVNAAYAEMLECFVDTARGGPDDDLLDGETAVAELETALAIRGRFTDETRP